MRLKKCCGQPSGYTINLSLTIATSGKVYGGGGKGGEIIGDTRMSSVAFIAKLRNPNK